ncbi:MAG TPA: DUF6184 family natural product biosynthesis lipoprotein [Polyangiaceae bacterium]|nr:DUF6184 family natural product biosynthesis lipoprotein [Polyangiaceae bacterium]
MTQYRSFTLMLVTSAAFLACDHDERPAATAPSTPAESHPSPVARADVGAARDDIVAARCDREVRCSNVGDGKSYEDRQACVRSLEGKTGDDLDANACSNGIDQPKLADCLAKIRAEDCGNPIDSLSRFAACRTGEICVGS